MTNDNLLKADKSYNKSQYLFIGLAIICFLGFYKTYFGYLTSFSSTKFVIHCHAITVTLWLFILIIQPILIAQKKIAKHKARTVKFKKIWKRVIKILPIFFTNFFYSIYWFFQILLWATS